MAGPAKPTRLDDAIDAPPAAAIAVVAVGAIVAATNLVVAL